MKRTSMQNLSSLIDGELAREDLPDLVSHLERDEEFQACWENYHLIGDTLRKNLPPFILPDLSERISAAIQNEPAYFLPQQARSEDSAPVPRRRAALGFALAASVTALAVVGMMQFSGSAGTGVSVQAPVAVAVNAPPKVQPSAVPSDQRSTAPVVYASVTVADAQDGAATPYTETDAGVDYPGEAADLYDYLVNYQRYAQTVSVQSGFHPAIQLVGYTPQ